MQEGKISNSLAHYCKGLQTWINWHLCLALPALELRSWPCLPSILQDNLLTSNGLSLISFSLLVKSEGDFFPFPFLHLFSEMPKHLAASKQGQTTNTWVLGRFFSSSPLLPELCSCRTERSEAVNGTFSPWIRNSLWLSWLDLEGPYSGADLITS